MLKWPIGWAIQRYWPSVVFPTIAVWSIYADWSRTQAWKKLKAEKAPLVGCYIGKTYDDAETERMSRFRDRSALYGRPPPPPGVKEIPSW